MRPKVKFKLNKSLDKQMAYEFFCVKKAGIDFIKGIIEVHPELKGIQDLRGERKKKELISKYFDYFYRKHKGCLEAQVKQFNQEWWEVEDRFFREAKKIFKGHPFPKGEYIGYLSIINCNPRFLKDKTFQIFYLHPQGVRYVTAHELLHFIFYDYAIKKHPKLFKGIDTERGIFWDIAEIFNAVILHTPNFIKVHRIKKKMIYPEHRKYISKLSRIWQESKDIDRFIVGAYNLVASRNIL